MKRPTPPNRFRWQKQKQKPQQQSIHPVDPTITAVLHIEGCALTLATTAPPVAEADDEEDPDVSVDEPEEPVVSVGDDVSALDVVDKDESGEDAVELLDDEPLFTDPIVTVHVRTS